MMAHQYSAEDVAAMRDALDTGRRLIEAAVLILRAHPGDNAAAILAVILKADDALEDVAVDLQQLRVSLAGEG